MYGMIISFFAFIFSFIILLSNQVGSDWYGIASIMICISTITTIIFVVRYNQKDVQDAVGVKEQSRQQYLNALKSNDKSNAVYWGKLFYGYGSCFTIHQQNNVQLQIQNDILSYSIS